MVRLGVTLGLLLAATSAVATPGAAAADVVSNPTFASDTSHWSASSNAVLARFKASNGSTYGRVIPRSSRGTKTISVRSSASAVLPVGTYVHVAAQISTTDKGRTVTFQLREVDPAGTVLRTWTDARKVTTTGWKWVGAHLTTKYPGSRVSVKVKESVRRKNSFRLRSINQSVTLGTEAPADSTMAADLTQCGSIDFSNPDQGSLTYADEFNGTQLDPNQWRIRDNTFLNQDAAYIDKDNVSVHDGYLDIMGKREPEASWRSDSQSLYGEENRVRKYSTGYVDSIKSAGDGSNNQASSARFSQKYGYFEARLLVPSTDTMSQGIWPAFWLRADNTPGEIDVLESYGAPTSRSDGFDPSPSYEWNSWQDTSQSSSKAHFLGRPKVTEPIYGDWHTFGVNWSPTCLRYTMDGKTVGTARPVAGETPYINGPTFDSPFHIRFNMQVGSHYWGWPDPSVTKDEFHYKVDWVHVYQKH
ncbi:MAG: hypothetical protein QOJ72_1641 [Nocardioidaceae bacterium]|nr:hypothetical protein [Nocardioidaceae bacterium]